MLKKTPTVCEGCSKGCNMEVQHEGNVIYRCVPRENLEINKFWMCDEGRFNYHYTQDSKRIMSPRSGETSINWDDAIQTLKTSTEGKKVTFLVGSDLTQEELSTVVEYVNAYQKGSSVYHFGTEGVFENSDDGQADKILKMKSKTSNLAGAEKLGIQSIKHLKSSSDVVVIVRGGRADLGVAMKQVAGKKLIGMGVFQEQEASSFSLILPGLAFTEKEGTIVNHSGIEQKIKRAILPRNTVKAISEILMLTANKKAKEAAV